MFNNYFYFHRVNELNEIIFINKNFNNSINCLIKSSKILIILRKKDLLMI